MVDAGVGGGASPLQVPRASQTQEHRKCPALCLQGMLSKFVESEQRSRTYRQCSPLSGANKKRTPGRVPDVPSYFIHFMYHFVSAYAITSLIAVISSS